MKFIVACGLISSLFLMGGCDPAQFTLNGTQTETLSSDDVVLSTDALNSNLALVTPQSSVRIGQNLSSSLIGGFRKPDKAVIIKELPPGFGNGFTSTGWESPQRTVSMVGREDDLVLAIDVWDALSQEKMAEHVRRYEEIYGLPDSKVEGSSASYRFWNNGSVRLMICSVPLEKDMYTVTTSLGLAVLMDRLRMNEDSAKRDIASADQIKVSEKEHSGN